MNKLKLKPLVTEKSLKLAGLGKYTFSVARNLDKKAIKNLVEQVFSVHVVSVKTLIKAGEIKKNFKGKKKVVKSIKKAIVTLKEKEKIDLFESKNK
ncbi:50S ribosomal protein L23 [Candidatus Woesebacteria bacterium RBG_13_34_9]|uniref:Large ribosomal subunit protein uL23 n=1 Tax=Candidatus Woesebacteria bacterium RBG_13_34_9 TaxID=1802477 RepID=A0A1F7X2V9_9BACT|nr:MAG: 50S ribosomal protein L23 [Candidatus Woesebacteria bacterium RBG_13_34_9]